MFFRKVDNNNKLRTQISSGLPTSIGFCPSKRTGGVDSLFIPYLRDPREQNLSRIPTCSVWALQRSGDAPEQAVLWDLCRWPFLKLKDKKTVQMASFPLRQIRSAPSLLIVQKTVKTWLFQKVCIEATVGQREAPCYKICPCKFILLVQSVL